MKPFPCLFLPLTTSLSLFLLIHASTGQNLIKETCKTCSRNNPNIKYNFCTSSLQAVSSSQYATLRGLNLISIRLIQYNVNNTMYHIKNLMKDTILDEYVRNCLEDCFDLYSDSIDSTKEAIMNYISKRYFGANIQISLVMTDCMTCEDGFEEEGVVSPLTKRNDNTFQLSAIALCIMKLLQNGPTVGSSSV